MKQLSVVVVSYAGKSDDLHHQNAKIFQKCVQGNLDESD